MSAASKYPPEFGYAGLRMKASEYIALGETNDRYELIDGIVVMSPSPLPRHQKVRAFLAASLVGSAKSIPGLEFFPDTDVIFAEGTVYRPDFSIYAPGKLRGVPIRLTLVPDLVIEILSPGSKPLDLVTKRDDYGRFGVGEYWVIDPADLSVRLWRSRAGQFEETPMSGETLASTAIAGVVLDLAALRTFMR